LPLDYQPKSTERVRNGSFSRCKWKFKVGEPKQQTATTKDMKLEELENGTGDGRSMRRITYVHWRRWQRPFHYQLLASWEQLHLFSLTFREIYKLIHQVHGSKGQKTMTAWKKGSPKFGEREGLRESSWKTRESQPNSRVQTNTAQDGHTSPLIFMKRHYKCMLYERHQSFTHSKVCDGVELVLQPLSTPLFLALGFISWEMCQFTDDRLILVS